MNSGYVLITPARNEEQYIEKTIESVIAQTVPPKKWLIINDHSDDSTGEIIRRYESKHSFISLLNLTTERKRSFGAKALAFASGYELIKDVDFACIANVDADIILEADYYEKVLEEFIRCPALGIAGGIYLNHVKGDFVKDVYFPSDYVPGALQVFRRECFEQIGGYLPLKYGGMDTWAILMAQMHNWTTRSIEELVALHLRPGGTGGGTRVLNSRFREGMRNYNLGMHPAYAMIKGIRRITEYPYGIGALFSIAGYLKEWLTKAERQVSIEFIEFVQHKEIDKLKAFFSSANAK